MAIYLTGLRFVLLSVYIVSSEVSAQRACGPRGYVARFSALCLTTQCRFIRSDIVLNCLEQISLDGAATTSLKANVSESGIIPLIPGLNASSLFLFDGPNILPVSNSSAFFVFCTQNIFKIKLCSWQTLNLSGNVEISNGGAFTLFAVLSPSTTASGTNEL